MNAHRTRAAVALCAALSLTATMAQAQTAAQPDPRDAEARAHFERGLSLVQQARWADAVGELEAARAIRAVPAVLFNLGVAHRALGHNLRAIENFRAYLAAVPAGGVSNRESEVQTYINDLTAGVARIRFELQPANVTITLDGEGLAPDTREREVDPGTHVVTLSAPRFRSRQETVQLAPGASTTVRASLVRSDVIVRGPSGGPFVVMGVGGAALIAGVAFTVVRAGAFARYEMLHCDAVTMAGLQHCEPMTLPPDSDYTLGVTMTYAADVSYIAGGIAAAGGLTWLLLSLRNNSNAQEPSAPVSAWVSPTPRGAIVGVGGRM